MNPSILGRLDELAARHGDKPAVTGSGQVTYAQLNGGARRLAATLAGLSDRRICVDYAHQAHSYLALMAGLAADREVTVVRPDLVRAGQLPTWVGTPVSTIAPDPAGDARPVESPPAPGAPEPDTAALISLTTGSTGPPKGARIAVRTVHRRNEVVTRSLGLTASDVVLAPLHLGAAYAQTVYVPAMLAGATIVTVPPDEDAMLEAAQRHRATVLIATPTVWWNVVLHQRRPAAALRALRLPAIGAEPIPVDLVSRLRSVGGAEPVLMYGTTEIGVAMLGRMTDRGPRFRPVPGVRCVVEPDDQGRRSLVVDGPLFDGYLDPAGDLRTRPAGAWCTGDLAEEADDGVQVLGRVDAMVKRGRRWVDPSRIEADICRCSGVRQSCVSAVDDRRVGVLLVAVVSVFDRATTAARVMQFLRGRQPPGELPDLVVVCDDLPHQGGKVDRAAVRRTAEAACAGGPAAGPGTS